MSTLRVLAAVAVALSTSGTDPGLDGRPVLVPRGPAVVVVAAGDIACEFGPCAGDRGTARRIRAIDPDAVLPLGDNQYPSGRLGDYRRSYDRSWGRFLDRSYPVPGNHEYLTKQAAGYFTYFDGRVPGTRGWYSFDLGSWHLIALNSRFGGRPSTHQLAWLEDDLSADSHDCQLAYWHVPRFSSGIVHGSNVQMRPFWRLLSEAGAEIVVNGHEHHYERFRPMLPDGSPSPAGIREFVVGTGGYSADYPFRHHPLATSRKRLHRIGVLRLRLRPDAYDWAFVGPGGRVFDGGSGDCRP